MKSDGDKVESLERIIASKEEDSVKKDKVIKELNERIETLLVSSVEETQKRSQLQSRYEMLEKSFMELRDGNRDESTSPVHVSSLLSSSAIYDLLAETQEKVEDLQIQLSSLDKECAMVRIVGSINSSYVRNESQLNLNIRSTSNNAKKPFCVILNSRLLIAFCEVNSSKQKVS